MVRVRALDSISDPQGNVTSWTRDLQYRIKTKTISGQLVASYDYEDATSRLQSVTDALNQVVSYTYKLDDQLASITYTGGQRPTLDVTFGYDTNYPRLTSVATVGLGTTSFS